MFLQGFDLLCVCLQDLCKEDDSLESIMENVIVLRQALETATDAPPAADTEPTLPAPETLAAQFNHRYRDSSVRTLTIQTSTNVTFKMTAIIWSICLDLIVFVDCRTVFILSEALDEQLKTLWFSPFQTDEIETDLDMVSVAVFLARLSVP